MVVNGVSDRETAGQQSVNHANNVVRTRILCWHVIPVDEEDATVAPALELPFGMKLAEVFGIAGDQCVGMTGRVLQVKQISDPECAVAAWSMDAMTGPE